MIHLWKSGYPHLLHSEILHISQMAGRISRNKSPRRMYSEIRQVNESYILFENQYDLVECTYDEEGTKLYHWLRRKMQITENKKEVNDQMKSLTEYAGLLSGRWTRWFLAIVSVVCSAISILQFLGITFAK